MGQLKGMVRSRSKPEDSIVEGKIAEEVIEFYTDYLKGVESIDVPEFRHEGRLTGVGTNPEPSLTVGNLSKEIHIEFRRENYGSHLGMSFSVV
jgi:Domain of unknown function (DUF4218)